MASGHVNRTNRPNTWLHRPSLRREESPCQSGAVHTWHFSGISGTAPLQPQLKARPDSIASRWKERPRGLSAVVGMRRDTAESSPSLEEPIRGR
jgi:hypothetical protein